MVAGGLLYFSDCQVHFIYVQYTRRMSWHERLGDPMAFWIGLAIFILASIVAERLLPPQYKKFMPILVMVVLTFFGLFRYEIGTDYDWYIVLFDTVKIDDLYPEPTFLLLVDFLHQFHFSYQVMFIA